MTTQADLSNLLTDISQLVQTIKGEWEQQGAWSEWDQSVQDRLRAALEAALASPAAQTEDWVLVPREPTEAMLDAAFGLFDRVGVTTKVPAALGFEAWHAMIAAAPSAPQPTEPVAAKLIERFNQIVASIENRSMAVDGPVTPTLRAADEGELAELWSLLQGLLSALASPVAQQRDEVIEVSRALECGSDV